MKAIETAVTKANELLVALEKLTDAFQSTEGLKLLDTRILKSTFDSVIQAIQAEQTGTIKRRTRAPNKPKAETDSHATTKGGVTKAGALTPTEAARIADNGDDETEEETKATTEEDDDEEEGQIDLEKEVAKKKAANHLNGKTAQSKLGKKSGGALFS